jgi:hypothetical protein
MIGKPSVVESDEVPAAEPTPAPAPATSNTDRPEQPRPPVRVSALYATPWLVGPGANKQLPSAELPFGPLVGGYDDAGDQLPTVISRERYASSALRATRWKSDSDPLAVSSWLFALPSRRIIAAIRLELDADLADLPALLDDLNRGLVQVGGQTLSQVFASQAGVVGSIAPERHVVVSCWADDGTERAETEIHDLLYPGERSVHSEYASVQRPAELNLGGDAWVSPYATVTVGDSGEVDSAVLISAVLAVGSAAALREIRTAADDELRSLTLADARGRIAPGRVEERLERLARLETIFGLAVESAAEIGTLVHSRAVEGYHRALYRALDLSGRATAVSRLLNRLERSLSAMVAATASTAHRREQRDRDLWSAAFWLILAVGLPAAVALGYAGRDSEYTADDRSTYIAGAATALALLAILVIVTLVNRRRSQD